MRAAGGAAAARAALALASLAVVALAAAGCRGTSEAPDRPPPTTIRVAVIGGML